MTCSHVLGLIDAGPFADYPDAHLEAAWVHARQCSTCGPALELATTLTTRLGALPQVAPPPDLAKAVLARIAQVEQPHGMPADAVPRELGMASAARTWPAWATAVGGLAAGLAVVLSIPLDRAWLDLVSPRVGGAMSGVDVMTDSGAGATVLAAGLVVYVWGLFGGTGGVRERSR
jgi:hypothetical protein